MLVLLRMSHISYLLYGSAYYAVDHMQIYKTMYTLFCAVLSVTLCVMRLSTCCILFAQSSLG